MGRELRLLTLGGNRPEVEKKAKGGHELVHRHRKSLVLPITKFQWNKDENFLVEEDRIIEPINSNSNVEFSDKLQAGTDSLLASSDKVLLEG